MFKVLRLDGRTVLVAAAVAVLGCNADVDGAGLSFGQVETGEPGDDGGDDGGTDQRSTDGTTGGDDGDDGDDGQDGGGTTGDPSDGDDDNATTNALDGTGGEESEDDGPSEETGEPGRCMPGEMQDCYTGPANTENVGECTAGTQVCSAAGTWDACGGDVLPTDEECNGLDDDCNGTPDDGNPEAGTACNTALPGICEDGVTVCQGGGLVCESVTPAAPAETCGNQEDDDCNGTIDDGCTCDPLNPLPGCGAGQQCQPQPDDSTVCIGPMGTGTQYTACTALDDCSPLFACIQTTVTNAWCMQWCFSDAHCGLFDFCTPLDPAVFADGQEYGVCWDGFP
ncbi:MAG: hypothetical protein AAF721_02820 [Myxococcota bacterium]